CTRSSSRSAGCATFRECSDGATRRSPRRRSRDTRAREPERRPVRGGWLVLALVLAVTPMARGEDTVRLTLDDALASLRRQNPERLAFELRARFVALLEATERLRLARENLEHYRETVRVSEARAREGDISRAEIDKIALEQRGFEREVADAEGDRREAVAALLPLVGVDAADVEPVGELALP